MTPQLSRSGSGTLLAIAAQCLVFSATAQALPEHSRVDVCLLYTSQLLIDNTDSFLHRRGDTGLLRQRFHMPGNRM